MTAVNPIPQKNATSGLREIYQSLTQKFGLVPNIFGTMAHTPEALKTFLPFFGAVMSQGSVAESYKELAYLKTSNDQRL